MVHDSQLGFALFVREDCKGGWTARSTHGRHPCCLTSHRTIEDAARCGGEWLARNAVAEWRTAEDRPGTYAYARKQELESAGIGGPTEGPDEGGEA